MKTFDLYFDSYGAPTVIVKEATAHAWHHWSTFERVQDAEIVVKALNDAEQGNARA